MKKWRSKGASAGFLTALLVMGTAAVGTLGAQASGGGSMALRFSPGLVLPLAGSAELFGTGGGSDLGLQYETAHPVRRLLGAGLNYGYAPIKSAESLSILCAEALGGVGWAFAPRFAAKAQAGAGWFFARIHEDGASGQNPALSAGIGLSYLAGPLFDLNLSIAYRNYLGLYHGISLTLGSSYFLSGRDDRKERIDSGLPLRPELLMGGAKPDRPEFGVDMESLALEEVYPVFKSYYDTRPVGSVRLVNKAKETVSDIRVSFFARQFMDAPKPAAVPESLAAGESGDVELTSLFNAGILEVTEATKTAAEITLEYRMDGELYRDTRQVTLRVLDRNAMRWDDDRRASAFVTAKDPKVLTLAKFSAGLVRDQGPQAIDRTLLQAIALYRALGFLGVAYVVDPKTPFATFSENAKTVDYLQFPRQTLEYRAGDCDDLSILIAALLESVGIEAAFVTVPGHIYVSFALETPPAELSRVFSSEADFIIRDGKAWVPLEVTLRREGFLRAWQEGARQWREAGAKDAAVLIPLHDAWREFEPVGLPGGSGELVLPAADQVLAAFFDEAGRLAERELAPRAKRLEDEIARSGDSPASRNKLGVLYGRYGLLERAEAEFRRALERSEYAPALVNLGNLHLLRKAYGEAETAYGRAARADPANAAVLVNLARLQYLRERYGEAKGTYERLLDLDPALAARHAYLGEAAGDSARAGSAAELRGTVEWSED